VRPGGSLLRDARWWVKPALAVVVLALLGTALLAIGGGWFSGPEGSGGTGSAPVAPQAQDGCTVTVTGSGEDAQKALDAARPGDRVCLAGDLGDTELQVRRSGTKDQPLTVLGGGLANTGQVTVKAHDVVIDGLRLDRPRSPGFQLIGSRITLSSNVIDAPQVVRKGDDGDGIRFFGNDIVIAGNLVRDARNLNGQKGNHADAIQTFATSDATGPSQRVTIRDNRFERIDNMCLIAEGPYSEAGDGIESGRSSGFTITGNYCESHAGQAFYFDDVSDVRISDNTIAGKVDKAFSLQNKSVNATIKDNHLGPKVGFEVGIDDSSEDGYDGPDPGGPP
jgi:hypothetical protein